MHLYFRKKGKHTSQRHPPKLADLKVEKNMIHVALLIINKYNWYAEML